MGLIPGLERSSGGGYGNPFQYSCLEDPGKQQFTGSQRVGHHWSNLACTHTHTHTHTHTSTMVQQAPLSMGFSRQEYWSGLPSSKGSSRPQDWTCVSYGSCTAGGFFITEPWGSPYSQVLAVKMQASWGVILPYSCGRILVKIEQMQQINISVAMKLNFLLEKENRVATEEVCGSETIDERPIWVQSHTGVRSQMKSLSIKLPFAASECSVLVTWKLWGYFWKSKRKENVILWQP